MSSKLTEKQITELQAQLEVEMAKTDNVSDGTLPIDIWERKAIVERTTPKTKVIKENKLTRVINRDQE